MSRERSEGLSILIAEQKEESFIHPEQISDAEALGILVAQWAEWEGKKIVEAFISALEDANYHSFLNVVEAAWKREQADQ